MKKLLLASTAISVMLMTGPASTGPLQVNQNPNPFQAFEDTAGNIEFLNISNISNGNVVITRISIVSPFPAGGEVDDEATNVVLIAPNPTVQNPVILTPNTNFNIKFSWDAVDNIKDKDVDFGLWQSGFFLDFTVGDSQFAQALLRVNDTPLPPALPLFATGLGGLGLLGWRRKRKAQAVA
jgi:hypothetical protein